VIVGYGTGEDSIRAWRVDAHSVEEGSRTPGGSSP
jgi:hypothetical protein